MKRLTLEEIIRRAEEVYGKDRYIFTNTVYENAKTKMSVICPKHGEFLTNPLDFVHGHGCPKCSGRGKLTTEEFIERGRKLYGDKYDYSKVEYKNMNIPVCVVCKDHGEFWVTPLVHLFQRSGCPSCMNIKRRTTESLIEEFKEKHGDKYDYSKVKFVKMRSKVCIICPEHGEFWQTPYKHLCGQGCPKCGVERRSIAATFTNDNFIERAIKVHGDTYDYSETNYKYMQDKVAIKCKKHGTFYQRPYDHLNGHGCPICGALMSKSEEDIYTYVVGLIGEDKIIRNDRKLLKGKEIDIYIPSMKIGFEYDGVKWYSEKFGKGRFYHLDKTEAAERCGVKLYHIFEDEWVYHREIVKSKIRHILGCDGELPRIMARKCNVVEIDRDIAKDFLDKYHVQGYVNCTVNIGCFYEDKLISVMSVLKEREEGKWNLVRFATDINYICQGVFGKVLKWFIKEYNPISIKTFADRRWTVDKDNNLYIKTGFALDGIVKPDYRYISDDEKHERFHKFNFRKSILIKKYGFSEDMTESEMTEKLGLHKIWDCGLFRYVWKKE
jgi:hypothetical protein